MTMQTTEVVIDRAEARELWRKYREHQHWEAPIDEEIRRTYKMIAQGRIVIRALDSIRAAGLGDDGLPKLAIARATAKKSIFRMMSNGSATYHDDQYRGWNEKRRRHELPAGTFSPASWKEAQAVVPIVPIHLRPKRALDNYHILWEADWREVPADPMLLRRLGRGDLWLVCAAWDLTAVERAALQARVSS